MTTTSRRHWLALAGSAVLAGCSRLPFFGEEEAPLPGKREPVLLMEEGVRPDPALAAEPVVLPPPRDNSAWTQLAGNAAHALGHPALAPAPRVIWRRDMGSGGGDVAALMAPPVVAQGRVYTVDADLVVRAFALEDGRELWARPLPLEEVLDRLRAGGLAHDEGRLYVTTTAGEVFGLDAANGAVRWRRQLGVPLEAPPAAAAGRLWVVTVDSRLLALDGTSGATLWQHAGFFEPVGLLGGAPPAVAGEVVVVPYPSGQVFALRRADGRPLWSANVLRPRRTLAISNIADITAAPVIDGQRVYVAGNGGETSGFLVADGRRLWSLDLAVRLTPWLAGGFLYLLGERRDVVCLRREDGRVRWVSRLPGDGEASWAGPVLAGGRLWFAGSQGELLALDPARAAVVTRIPVGGAVSLPPVVAQRTMLLQTDEGELVALR